MNGWIIEIILFVILVFTFTDAVRILKEIKGDDK